MGAYSHRAQPYLDAIAVAVFGSAEVRNWLLSGTKAFDDYVGADVLTEEQAAVRWKIRKTKQPFWANYWCGRDAACTCRPDGSSSLESDAIFFFRKGERTLAVHIEFKHRKEELLPGQAEGYPLRAECFAKTHASRKTLNTHEDWVTVLVCDSASLLDRRVKAFDRIVTHKECEGKIPGWPGGDQEAAV